jgi:lysophospholipase L1-like esterase
MLPLAAQGPPPASAAVAVPRADGNSKTAHEQLLAKTKQGKIDLYFLGDSITRRWGCSDPQWSELLANWNKNFHGWNAGNFGWGADNIEHVLWRVQNGELEGVNPKVIVILAGTNNIGNRPGPPEKVRDIIAGIGKLVETCREKAPAAKIILTGILPRNDGGLAVIPMIREINEAAAKLADGRSIHFIDINDKLAKPDGTLLEGMTVDQLHLSAKGYQVWADALNPLLTELLGPKAPKDLAPPPSCDPKLTKPVTD